MPLFTTATSFYAARHTMESELSPRTGSTTKLSRWVYSNLDVLPLSAFVEPTHDDHQIRAVLISQLADVGVDHHQSIFKTNPHLLRRGELRRGRAKKGVWIVNSAGKTCPTPAAGGRARMLAACIVAARKSQVVRDLSAWRCFHMHLGHSAKGCVNTIHLLFPLSHHSTTRSNPGCAYCSSALFLRFWWRISHRRTPPK